MVEHFDVMIIFQRCGFKCFWINEHFPNGLGLTTSDCFSDCCGHSSDDHFFGSLGISLYWFKCNLEGRNVVMLIRVFHDFVR